MGLRGVQGGFKGVQGGFKGRRKHNFLYERIRRKGGVQGELCSP